MLDNTTAIRARANRIRSICGALGVDEPADLAAAFTRAADLTAAAENLSTGATLGTPVRRHVVEYATELLAGGDSIDTVAGDPALHALVVRSVLVDLGVQQAATDRAATIVTDAVTDAADTLTEAWSTAVAADTTTLTTAATGRFADTRHLTDITPDRLRDPDDFATWQQTIAAAHRIDTALTGFGILARHTRRTVAAGDWVVCTFTAAGPDELDTVFGLVDREYPRETVTPWMAARAGLRLSLPVSLTAYDERVRAVGVALGERRIERDEVHARAGFGKPSRADRARTEPTSTARHLRAG